MKGFWSTLAKPFFALAPMADVTDAAFRRIIAETGKPDVMWTEFVSADGLFLGGRKKLIRDLVFSEAERPIVAQFFSARPEYMEKAAALARELGFDGVDINMGCPDKSVERQGAGAALIKDTVLARELIAAAKEGAREIPVSVKTRTGYNRDELEVWLPALLAERPAAITLHARTRKEMSLVPARWEDVARAVALRDELQPLELISMSHQHPTLDDECSSKNNQRPTLIVGNGDALSMTDARLKAEESGADGVMLGRAIFGNPWLFSGRLDADITLSERLLTLVRHAELFEKLLGDIKSFAIMKKHFKAYAHGFAGAKELREELMACTGAKEVRESVERFLARLV